MPNQPQHIGAYNVPAFILTLLVLCLGCRPAPALRRFFATCGGNAECASGLCYQGLCTSSCNSSTPCSSGLCVAEVCAPTCDASRACPGDWTCAGSACQAPKPGGGSEADAQDQLDAGPKTVAIQPGRIVAGDAFTCALDGQGTVRCWGINDQGQLGTANTDTQHQPTLASIVPKATALVACLEHVCALTGQGQVVCWGGTGTGAADGNPAIDKVASVALPEVAVALAAGKHFTCALAKGGTVYCWGDNEMGELGDNQTQSRAEAKPVVNLSGVTAIAAGEHHACAVRNDKTVWCWGQFAAGWSTLSAGQPYRTPQQISGVSNAAGIAAGGVGTCILDGAGALTCWGDNGIGQLGFGDTEPRDGPTAASAAGKYRRLAMAGTLTCGVGEDRKVRCWGQGEQGQLGDGIAGFRTTASLVAGIADAVDVAVGANHACAVTTDNRVLCWGGNDQGQTGNGTSDNEALPVQMQGFADAKAASVGHGHICLVRQGGQVACSGRNALGALGIGSQVTQFAATAVPGVSGASAVATGQSQTCSLGVGEQLRCWGGDLLVGALTPQPVEGLPTAQSLACGAGTTCAASAGKVLCWGNDEYGSLGNGPQDGPTDQLVSVSDLTDAQGLAGKWSTFCAIRKTGQLVCWGRNDSGQAGVVNEAQPVATPTAVGMPAAATTVQVVLGYDIGCARLTGGAVACWGAGGQNYTGGAVPTQVGLVPGLSGCDDIAVTDGMLCGLIKGQVSCVGAEVPGGWNANDPPKSVVLPGAAIDIDGGPHDQCAVLQSGQVWCWGYNEYGQLGNGKGPVITPVQVLP